MGDERDCEIKINTGMSKANLFQGVKLQIMRAIRHSLNWSVRLQGCDFLILLFQLKKGGTKWQQKKKV